MCILISSLGNYHLRLISIDTSIFKNFNQGCTVHGSNYMDHLSIKRNVRVNEIFTWVFSN